MFDVNERDERDMTIKKRICHLDGCRSFYKFFTGFY